ncbi:MAG TPA: hypothetical protein VGI63_03820 [Verrucomicrobiae bacterium]|jgi:hypothetical protein
MGEFLKCECWYCGQSINYPFEATGISVLCPRCRRHLTLKSEGSTGEFGSIAFPSDAVPNQRVAIKEIIPLDISPEHILLHKAGKLEAKLEEVSRVARARRESATDKQKEKLVWFGCTFDETITKGQASDALDKCAMDFPLKDMAYYKRPATEKQISQIREYAKVDKDLLVTLEEIEEGESFTYEAAKYLLRNCEKEAEQREWDKHQNPPDKTQLEQLKTLGFTVDIKQISAAEADMILNLKGAPPREDDLSLFEQHGLLRFQGDGLGAFALGDLIRSFGGSAQDHNRKNIDYVTACMVAVNDPDYQTPKLTRDRENFVAFAWPKSKIREWLRAAKSDYL